MKDSRVARLIVFCFFVLVFLPGCALVIQKGRRTDLERIESLEGELSEIRTARSLLEDKLSKEIGNNQVKIDSTEKGLVITVMTEVLFDSGKAKLREECFSILDKVSSVLRSELGDHNIGIEGHTDNVPITHSAWKDNWELSLQRAYSVLKHIESEGVDSERLSASGYGEYKPVASNESKEGRQLNRRVEIVVLPKLVKKLEAGGFLSDSSSEEVYK